jgi:hypothetical protein
VWSGNDISQFPSPSAVHCAKSCQTAQNCLCFAYTPADANCVLKSSCSGSGVIASNVQSGFCPK